VPPRILTGEGVSALDGLTPHSLLHARILLTAHPELRPTSGRRTPERNRAVGGVPRSFHLSGRAVDFAGDRGLLRRAAQTARAQRVTHGCTGPEEVIDEGDHLHVAW
jgi:uncharacterized protein YcbK (DUF882 family)